MISSGDVYHNGGFSQSIPTNMDNPHSPINPNKKRWITLIALISLTKQTEP